MLKKTAFVPRLAFGCVGLGMGVIPLCVACSSDDKGAVSIGIRPAIFDASAEGDAPGVDIPDASGTDAPTVGIIPYVPDASAEADAPSVGILPAIPDAAGEAGD
jgi:hypothetical protein